MESFIRTDQYNFIKDQTHTLLHGHSATTDSAVTQALKSLTHEKVFDLFHDLSEEQKQVIDQIQNVQDEADAIFFLSRMKQHIIPFPQLDEKEIKILFPKVKKLNVPFLDEIDWNETSYLGWNDPGAQRKYLVTHINDRLVGIEGTFIPSRQQGICTICKEHEEVGMFTTTRKGAVPDETISRGNYICKDSQVCNQNLKSLSSLQSFIQRVNK